MGDALDASEQAMFNFDILAVHVAFMQSIEDNQGPGGDVPVVIPAGIPGNGSCSDIAWTSAYPQITNMLYSCTYRALPPPRAVAYPNVELCLKYVDTGIPRSLITPISCTRLSW